MSEPLQPLWLALAIDLVAEEMLVLGFAGSRAGAEATYAQAGPDHFRAVFDCTARDFARTVDSWLAHHKVPGPERKSILLQFIDQIRSAMHVPDTQSDRE